jgi:hypothetical protein
MNVHYDAEINDTLDFICVCHTRGKLRCCGMFDGRQHRADDPGDSNFQPAANWNYDYRNGL